MNVVDINTLKKQFEAAVSVEEWRIFAEKQTALIESYHKEIELLGLKNRQLETMLVGKVPLITELSTEERICIEQIDRLDRLSAERQLTLDEVKRLDLLVKNMKLIREESTVVVNNRPSASLGEVDLVRIATREES